MDHLPGTSFITNDTERSFIVPTTHGHTDLSILTPSGDDPAHLYIAEYENGSDEPISEVKLYAQEAKYARKLLNDPQSLQILGVDD